MEASSLTNEPKPTGSPSALQKPLKTPVSTHGTHGPDSDQSSKLCSRHRQLWSSFLESLGREPQSPPMTPACPPPPVSVKRTELVADLLRKCAEYDQNEAERQHKENYETWRNFIQAAVQYAWDEAKRRKGATDGQVKHLAEEAEDEREERESMAHAVWDEAPPVLVGLPPDDEVLPERSEKRRRDHIWRQERRKWVRHWVKEQRELVVSQRRAKKNVQVTVPRNVGLTWLDQLREEAQRERSEFRLRSPGTVIPSNEPRHYPWDDYLREKNGKSLPNSDRTQR